MTAPWKRLCVALAAVAVAAGVVLLDVVLCLVAPHLTHGGGSPPPPGPPAGVTVAPAGG